MALNGPCRSPDSEDPCLHHFVDHPFTQQEELKRWRLAKMRTEMWMKVHGSVAAYAAKEVKFWEERREYWGKWEKHRRVIEQRAMAKADAASKVQAEAEQKAKAARAKAAAKAQAKAKKREARAAAKAAAAAEAKAKDTEAKAAAEAKKKELDNMVKDFLLHEAKAQEAKAMREAKAVEKAEARKRPRMQ